MAIEYRWAENHTIGCRRWRPIWFAAGGRDRRERRTCGARGQGGDHDNSDRLRRPATIRSELVWSPASTGRAATSPASVFFAAELAAKRLELLHELVPKAARIAVLVDPTNPDTETELRDVQAAARAIGLQILIVECQQRTRNRCGLCNVRPSGAGALLVGSGPFFTQPARTACRAGGPPRDAGDLRDRASSPRPAA